MPSQHTTSDKWAYRFRLRWGVEIRSANVAGEEEGSGIARGCDGFWGFFGGGVELGCEFFWDASAAKVSKYD